MPLITETIKVKICGSNVKHYQKIGYAMPIKKASASFKKRWGRNFVIDLDKEIEIKAEDIPKGSRHIVKDKCDCCGEILDISYSVYYRYVHKDGKYYCNHCNNKVFNSGQNNTSYNPNKTEDERIKGRIDNDLKEFVKKVMRRDGYTCKCCGKKINHDGVVHHLDGYNWCKEKRTDETNGITLCETCHKNFHLKYGNGNNIKEQFEEWIGNAIYDIKKYSGELPVTKRPYCIETNQFYNSVKEAGEKLNIKASDRIYDMCNRTYKKRKRKDGTIHKQFTLSVNGYHFMWYEEYLKQINNQKME
ncbi:HNH endonuclease [Clostridium butyricum]